MLKLLGHTRYAYSPIVERKDYSWPGGKRLAFYVALNVEHFAYGHHPATTVITFRQRLDLIGHGLNSLVEPPPVTSKFSDDPYHAW